jgi:hypothetical protein
MTLLSWGRFFGVLAAEAAIIILLASLVVRLVHPVWQRAIWNSTVVVLIALLAIEFSGIRHSASDLLFALPQKNFQPPGT